MYFYHIHASNKGILARTAVQDYVFSVVLAVAALAAPSAHAEGRQCQITSISNGFATLIRDSETFRSPVGQLIKQGDKLAKSASARVSITCSDGGEITIGRASEVDLGNLVSAPIGEPRVFRILRGVAGFVMPKQAAPVEVETLNAVASVRSTEWTVDVDGDTTHVFVREGLVQVTGTSGQTAPLGSGEGVSVLADGSLGPVASWGQGRIDAMNARLGGDWR